jgi:hypothetical protein
VGFGVASKRVLALTEDEVVGQKNLPSAKVIARVMQFLSSRMLPGQS